MFYVIEIMNNKTCQLIGPKCWEECQEIMVNILDGINQYDKESIENGYFYDSNIQYTVEIIQCDNE